jgi:cytochrome P450
MMKGTYVHDLRKLHEKYGEAVRTAPDEVSFAAPQAWHDILDHLPEGDVFPKNPRWYKLPNGKPDPGMPMTCVFEDHNRMRKLMEHGFTQKALRAQEAIIQSYVSLLMTRLRERAAAGGPQGGVVDMVDWFNFTAFDIVGDLGFGEPFGCLEESRYHPWITMVFDYVKALTLTAMVRHYPVLETILMRLLPQSLLEKQKQHFQHVADKIDRRMNLETQRDDFVTPLITRNKDMKAMSMLEIQSTLNIAIVAGSETTATSLSGLANSLVQHPAVLQKLVSEIRGTFAREEDITMAATKDLPYLNACIWEGLRTSSPTPCGMPRMSPARGGTVCGRPLPGNTFVSVAAYTLQFSPEQFTDPEKFLPERWLPPPDRPAEIVHHNPAAIQPFGMGPMRCIGREIGWVEMRLVIARILWNFDISMGDPSKPLDWNSLKTYLLVEKEPVLVRLKPRVF